ncbi:MAG: zinc ribbon domain-containing protein [Planctomycetota bacterium]|jgi:predicted nucleic acid-binding Zn ribbon protein
MHCPKCGTANPEDARLCTSCGSNFPGDQKTGARPKPEISVKAQVLQVIAFLLVFLPLLLLSVISTLATVVTAIWLTRRSIKTVVKFLKSDVSIRRKVLGLILLIACDFSVVGWLLFNLDAEPIPNDYTVADFRSAASEYSQSYEFLKSLGDVDKGDLSEGGAYGIGLSKQDLEIIEQVSEALKGGDYSRIREVLGANAEGINRAWENAGRGRDIIRKLSEFREIADLTEPDFNAYIGFLANLRKSAQLYLAYVCLQTEQGDNTAAVRHLIEFDWVFRKLSVNARSTITKFVCIAGLAINTRTANFVANNPRSSDASLELLAEHFTPYTDEQLSWRNQIICEYLNFKNMFSELPFVGRWPAVKNLPFFKRNSTLRVSRNWFNRILDVREGPNGNKREQLCVWPWLYPDLGPVSIGSDEQFPWYYRRYNDLGCMLLVICMPALGRPFSLTTRLKVEYELFRIVLDKRLGREVSLKASAYSDEYIVDIEKKVIFSPGPDGKPETEDDIKLSINPDVLQWTD